MYKIFLVDDDKTILDIYASKFHTRGHEVSTSHNGADALNRIKNGHLPDLIILDVMMPEMDGLTFLEIVRKEKLVPNSSVIMLTNQGKPRDVERAENLGISAYIIKATAIPSEVVSEVERILNKQSNG